MEPGFVWDHFYRGAFRPSTRRRAIRVALVVGTLLVLINQWEAIFGADPVNWLKFGLTYLVPWAVVTWTSVMNEIERASLQ